MSEPVLNFVACPWCTSGNAADMGHWGKCPGAAERDRKAKERVAEMFAAIKAPVETATADQLRRKLLECEEALRTTVARAEKAEQERDGLRSILAELADDQPCIYCGNDRSWHLRDLGCSHAHEPPTPPLMVLVVGAVILLWLAVRWAVTS